MNKLDKNLDVEFHGEILFCLGKIIDLNHGKQKIKVLEYAKDFAKNANATTRENAIIVLGWLGGNREIELLGNTLLHDTNNKCRAWSASSFMQISFRKKINAEKVLPYLYKSIKQEHDNFVIESVINTLQEITENKFGLRKKDMNINNIEAVHHAKIKVLKYFDKKYGK
ncbi:MAG: HEAT repeat domain-containing protein [Tannerella sp.]|nr:HEAT repeat domain-containing protein [Tannerella sp.]